MSKRPVLAIAAPLRAHTIAGEPIRPADDGVKIPRLTDGRDVVHLAGADAGDDAQALSHDAQASGMGTKQGGGVLSRGGGGCHGVLILSRCVGGWGRRVSAAPLILASRAPLTVGTDRNRGR